MARWRRMGFAFAFGALAAAPLHAAPSETKAFVAFETCAELNQTDTRKLLSLELGNLAERSVVTVSCESTSVFLSVASGERQGSRRLNLAGTERRAWPRIVALSAMELLTEPMVPAPSGVNKAAINEATQAPAIVAVDVAPRPVSAALFAGALIRAVPRLGTTTMGLQMGGAGLWPQPNQKWRLGARAAVGFERGQHSLDAGEGVANAASVVVSLLVLRPGLWAPWASAGLRAGGAWLRGDASSDAIGSSFAAPWLGPEMSLGMDWRGVRDVGASLHVDAGYAAVAAVGRGASPSSPRFGYDGAWLALNLSLALQL